MSKLTLEAFDAIAKSYALALKSKFISLEDYAKEIKDSKDNEKELKAFYASYYGKVKV